jgi:hypothetical protein
MKSFDVCPFDHLYRWNPINRTHKSPQLAIPLFAMFRNVQGFHHRFSWVYFSTNGAHMKPSGGFLQHDPVAARSGAGCGCILPGGSGPVLQLLGISSWGYHGSWWIQKWQVMYACSLLFRSCIVINYG